MLIRGMVFVFVCVLLAACCAVDASDAGWYWHFVDAPAAAVFGTGPNAPDGFGPDDLQVASPSSVYIGTYHEQDVDNWSGPTGFYRVDWQPLLQPGQTEKWTFYLWGDPLYPREPCVDLVLGSRGP